MSVEEQHYYDDEELFSLNGEETEAPQENVPANRTGIQRKHYQLLSKTELAALCASLRVKKPAGPQKKAALIDALVSCNFDYNEFVLTDDQLVMMLTEEGLPTTGTDAELAARLAALPVEETCRRRRRRSAWRAPARYGPAQGIEEWVDIDTSVDSYNPRTHVRGGRANVFSYDRTYASSSSSRGGGDANNGGGIEPSDRTLRQRPVLPRASPSIPAPTTAEFNQPAVAFFGFGTVKREDKKALEVFVIDD
jgi:hypothetical protein